MMERLTDKYWRNFDPWEFCGQDNYCKRGCHDQGGCRNGCIVPKLYCRLALYEETGLGPEEIKELEAQSKWISVEDRLPTEPSEYADRLIDNGVTVQEWVSVKDRLPEESGMYIVTANDGHAQRVSFVLWQKRNRMWNLTGARSYWRVTHWKPMPHPPKGE